MNINIRYEEFVQELVVDEEENLILSLNLVVDDDMSYEEKEKLVNKELKVKFNNPEYNNLRRHTRNQGVVNHRKENNTHVGVDELFPEDVRNKALFISTEDQFIENMEREELWKQVRSLLTDEQFDMVIAIAVEGMKAQEYAKQIGVKPNTVSQRYKRAKQILEKNLKNFQK